MSDDQNQRFRFVNNDDPVESDKHKVINDKNKINQYASNMNIMGIEGGLGWRSLQKGSLQNSRVSNEQMSEQQRQKDRRIKKLTNINKHLLEQLKQQNDQLTKRVNKQKYRIPKKSNNNQGPKNQQVSKQLQGMKRQLQNAYRQIQYYKQTISILKAKQMPIEEKQRVNFYLAKLKQKNQDIENIQNEIKTQKTIKLKQDKEIQKIQNQQLIQRLNKLNNQIKNSKEKVKDIKKTLSKRQQLQKKQHAYYIQLENLIKKKKIQDNQNQQEQTYQNNKRQQSNIIQEEITQRQWKQIKQKLAVQKKKYQEYGKKITYHNYMKSKQTKNLQQLQLKYKQKAKILQKLKSKLNQVNKLARLVPKPQVMQRVNLKMQKLKDIISRQNTTQLTNVNKIRVQSQDVRQFKKWELQHASRQNDSQDKTYNIKNQSEQQELNGPLINNLKPHNYYSLNNSQIRNQVQA